MVKFLRNGSCYMKILFILTIILSIKPLLFILQVTSLTHVMLINDNKALITIICCKK